MYVYPILLPAMNFYFCRVSQHHARHCAYPHSQSPISLFPVLQRCFLCMYSIPVFHSSGAVQCFIMADIENSDCERLACTTSIESSSNNITSRPVVWGSAWCRTTDWGPGQWSASFPRRVGMRPGKSQRKINYP